MTAQHTGDPQEPALIDSEMVARTLRVFAEAEDFAQCVGTCLDRLTELTTLSAIALFSLNTQRGQLELINSRGFTERAVEAGRVLSLTDTLTGLSIREGRILTSLEAGEDERIEPTIREEMAKLRNRTIISVPLTLYRQPVGAMNIVWNELRRLTTAEYTALYHLSCAMAIAVDHTVHEFEAAHDPLTGLRNRRAFEQTLAEFMAIHNRYGNPFSVAMIDVDHFKRINDAHGHWVGDTVLRGLGAMLLQRLRASDYACRYGGEEFVCLLPETGASRAVTVLEQLREDCAARSYPFGMSGPPQVTLSAGVAEYAGESAWAFVNRADQALYAAKANGRNQVQLAASEDGA